MHNGGKNAPFNIFQPQFFQMMMPKAATATRASTDVLTKDVEPIAKAAALSSCQMASLMSKRTQAYIQLPAAVASCQTPMDLLQKQQEFWQQCAKDYSAAAKAMRNAWSVAVPFTGFEETLEDQSLQSCPDAAGERDVMAVSGTESSTAGRSGPDESRSGRQETATAA